MITNILVWLLKLERLLLFQTYGLYGILDVLQIPSLMHLLSRLSLSPWNFYMLFVCLTLLTRVKYLTTQVIKCSLWMLPSTTVFEEFLDITDGKACVFWGRNWAIHPWLTFFVPVRETFIDSCICSAILLLTFSTHYHLMKLDFFFSSLCQNCYDLILILV